MQKRAPKTWNELLKLEYCENVQYACCHIYILNPLQFLHGLSTGYNQPVQ